MTRDGGIEVSHSASSLFVKTSQCLKPLMFGMRLIIKNFLSHLCTVQLGGGGFELAEQEPTWCEASTSARRKMVAEEVCRQQEAARSVKTVSEKSAGKQHQLHRQSYLRCTPIS